MQEVEGLKLMKNRFNYCVENMNVLVLSQRTQEEEFRFICKCQTGRKEYTIQEECELIFEKYDTENQC